MIIGQVVGSVWATRKEESLNGLKLLVVKPLEKNNSTMVAVDKIGAGIGDNVLVAGGSAARKVLDNKDCAVDATIVGIIDEMELEEF